MGRTTRKRYTREFKLSIIRELESGKKLGQLSRENNIHPNMISRWKLEYDKDPESAFKGNGNTYKDAAVKNWKGLWVNCTQRMIF